MRKFGGWSEQVDSKFRTSGDSKEVTLAVPSSLAAASLSLTLPDVSSGSDILVSNDSVSTLTNKTLTAPVIASIVNTGTLTLPTDTDTLVGRQTTDTLTNKSIDADNNTITNIDNSGIKAAAGIALDKLALLTGSRVPVTTAGGVIEASNVTNAELAQLSGNSFGGNAAGDVVTTDGTQTLTNKTLTSPILSDVSLTLPKINEAVALTATSTELNQLDGNTVGGVSAGDIATIDGLQTLTNKSIDADTNTVTNIDNADIKAAAAIALDKLAPLTGSRVPVTTAGGVIEASNVTNAELAQLSGNNFGGNTAGDVVTTDGTQTLTNKTLESFTYTKTSIAAASSIAKGANPVIELTGTAVDLQYITGGVLNEIRIVTNESNDVIKIINDAGGANGFYTGTGSDIDIPVNGSVYLMHDSDVGRWKVISGAGGAGGLTLANVSTTLNPAVKNTHYLTDSSGGAFTITLPAGEEGSVFRFSDVTGSWSTNNVTISPDGAETINGDTSLILDIDSTWAQLMWDGTEWKLDDAIVNDSADFTGDVSITGDLAVDNITDAAGTDYPALNGVKPTIFYKKAHLTSTQSSSVNPAPGMTIDGLEVGKTYRITAYMNGYVGTGGGADLTLLIYDGPSTGGGVLVHQLVHLNNSGSTGSTNFFFVNGSSTIRTITTDVGGGSGRLQGRITLTGGSQAYGGVLNTFIVVEELPYHTDASWSVS